MPFLLPPFVFVLSFGLYTQSLADDGCLDVEVQAHRGHYTQPENSSAAIKVALDKGYDGVEIDIQQLKDGAWVVHHDLRLGRALTGSKFTFIRRITSSKYNRLKHKSRTGSVTSLPATTLDQALSVFAKNANSSQKLNIEIKDITSCASIANMANKVSSKLKSNNYQFSSINRPALQCLRDSGYTGYVGLVVSPDSEDVTEKVKEKYGKYKSFANKYIKKYNITEISKKTYDKVGNYEVLKASGMTKLKRELGNDVGIHIDINTLSKQSSIIKFAKNKKIKLVTYGLNGDVDHAKRLSKIYKTTQWKPHTIIIDKKVANVCRAFNS
jgi:glycerophosphoryl diester phosphodiesterase